MKELYLCHICHAEINISFRTIWRSPKQWRQQLWESDFGHIFPDQEKLVLCIRIFKSGSPIHLFRWVEEHGRGRWWQDQSWPTNRICGWNPAFQATRRRRSLEEVRRGIVEVMWTRRLIEVARLRSTYTTTGCRWSPRQVPPLHVWQRKSFMVGKKSFSWTVKETLPLEHYNDWQGKALIGIGFDKNLSFFAKEIPQVNGQ